MIEPRYGNAVLDQLSASDREALTPHLRSVELQLGQVLIEQGGEVQTVHFPAGGQLANIVLFADGRRIETAVVGAEGVSGLAPFLAQQRCDWSVTVRAPGGAYAVAAEVLRAQAWRSGALMALLLRLTHYYQTQAAQTAACNATHGIRARVARWLLMADDLTEGAALYFTQEELASLLGVRRTSINEVMGQLKTAGGLRFSRGVIRALDRRLLEPAACECYAVLRDRTAQILAPAA